LAASASAGGDYPHESLVVSEYDPYSEDRMVT
jgi:hypothetical protein